MTRVIRILSSPADGLAARAVEQGLQADGFTCTADGADAAAGVLLFSAAARDDRALHGRVREAVGARLPVVVVRLTRDEDLPGPLLILLPDAPILDAYGLPQREHLRCLSRLLRDPALLAEVAPVGAAGEPAIPVGAAEVPPPALSSPSPPTEAGAVIRGWLRGQYDDPRPAMRPLQRRLWQRFEQLEAELAQQLQRGDDELARQTVTAMLQLCPTDRQALTVQQELNARLARRDRRRRAWRLGVGPFLKSAVWTFLVMFTTMSYCAGIAGGKVDEFFLPGLLAGLAAGYVGFCVYARFAVRSADVVSDEGGGGVGFFLLVLAAGVPQLILAEFRVNEQLCLGVGLTCGMLAYLAPRALRVFGPRLAENPLLYAMFGMVGLFVIGTVIVERVTGREELMKSAGGLALFFAAIFLLLALWSPMGSRLGPWLRPLLGRRRRFAPAEALGKAAADQRQLEELQEQFEYDAFISYRHTTPDRQIAEELQRQLEGYRAPLELGERGFPTRVRRVFRDQEELPSASNLSDNILQALRRSRYLIVVCSPRTPGSRWVAREIELFREMGGDDQILALLIEGEPAQSFPEPLRRRGGQEYEPLAADIRSDGHRQELRELAREGPPDPERFGHGPAQDLRGAVRLLGGEKLRLLAPIFGCGYDDLRQRHLGRLLGFWYLVAGTAFFALAILAVSLWAANR